MSFPCSVRVELTDAVSRAVQGVYDARASHQQNFKLMVDSLNSSVRLTYAKTTEREAVFALDKHRKKHGC